jgi:predicted small lipoprotein YifL
MNKVHPGPVHGRLVLAWTLLAATLLAIGTLGLGGCGVRGSLETPPAATTDTGGATPGTPGQPVPHKSSILDPLLR